MAFDLWARATTKWRGLLVYTLLSAIMRFVTGLIHMQTDAPGVALYASCAAVATSIFCLVQTFRLLTTDQPGDDAWPSLWS